MRRSHRSGRVTVWLKFVIAMAAMGLSGLGVGTGVSFLLAGAPPWQTTGPSHEAAVGAGIAALFVVLVPFLVWIRKSTPKSAYRKSRDPSE